MKIVKIEQQKRNKNRYSLYNEEGFFRGADAYVIRANNIQEGKEYSDEEINRWIEDEDLEKAKGYAADYLLGKTEAQMRTKLKQKDYSESVIEKTIDFLKRYQYVDDLHVGKALANDSVRLKKEGRNKIKQKMFQKGISKEDMDKVMSEFDEKEEKNAAIHTLQKIKDKYKRKAKHTYDWKTKCYQYLLRKGFPYEVATEVIEKEQWDF